MNEYIALDEISKEIQNSARLLQAVDVNALIIGEQGVGKKSLARFILPESKMYNARELQEAIQDKVLNIKNEAIIVNEINKLTNLDLFINWVKKNHIRVIATTQNPNLNQNLQDIFSINIELPRLEKRVLDTNELTKKFAQEASEILDMPYIQTDNLIKNVSNNTHSLRKSIYFSYLFENIKEEEILMFLEKYFLQKFETKQSYKELIYLFEVPLLRAISKKYPSQVKMAENLELNRITLRKKLDLYKDFLLD